MKNSHLDSEGFIKSRGGIRTLGGNDSIARIGGGKLTFDEIMIKLGTTSKNNLSAKVSETTNTSIKKEVKEIISVGDILSQEKEQEEIKEQKKVKREEEDFFGGVEATLSRGIAQKVTTICETQALSEKEGEFSINRSGLGHVIYCIVKDGKKELISEGIISFDRTTSNITIRVRGGKLGDHILVENTPSSKIPGDIGGYVDRGVESIARGLSTLSDVQKEISETIHKYSNKSAPGAFEDISYTVLPMKNETQFDLELKLDGINYNLVDVFEIQNKSTYTIGLNVKTENKILNTAFKERYIGTDRNRVKALHTFLRKIRTILRNENPSLRATKEFIKTFQSHPQNTKLLDHQDENTLFLKI